MQKISVYGVASDVRLEKGKVCAANDSIKVSVSAFWFESERRHVHYYDCSGVVYCCRLV